MEKNILSLNLKSINLDEFNKSDSVLIVVDMVKGFVEEGILSSPRVKEMSANLLELNNNMVNYKKVYFVDSHKEDCMEFKAYPQHCVENTSEEELIEGLTKALHVEDNITIIKKNSTNGFHAPEFKKWLDNIVADVKNFIVVGCVTDICVLQFTLTLKTYFNQMDMDKRIIVPANCVETFELPGHDGDEMNCFALTLMASNGIEVVSDIK